GVAPAVQYLAADNVNDLKHLLHGNQSPFKLRTGCPRARAARRPPGARWPGGKRRGTASAGIRIKLYVVPLILSRQAPINPGKPNLFSHSARKRERRGRGGRDFDGRPLPT